MLFMLAPQAVHAITRINCMLRQANFVKPAASKRRLDSFSGAWYTKHNGTTLRIIFQILRKWDDIFLRQSASCCASACEFQICFPYATFTLARFFLPVCISTDHGQMGRNAFRWFNPASVQIQSNFSQGLVLGCCPFIASYLPIFKFGVVWTRHYLNNFPC